MEKNKTGRYLKYAIGEIVLVVIGILIALSINNWNENRNQNIQLKNYLKSLNLEINKNIKVIEYGIKSSKRMESICIYYQNKFITNSPEIIKDTAITNFIIKINPIRPVKPVKVVLNEIVSSGNINLIKNNELKNKILNLDFIYDSYMIFFEESDKRYSKDIESYLNLNSDYSEVSNTFYKMKIKKGNFKHKRSAFLNNRILSNNLLLYYAMLNDIINKSKGKIGNLKKLQEEISKALQGV